MITIISGTNRPNSNSLKVSKYYQHQLNSRGIVSDILSLEELPDNLIESDMFGKRSDKFKSIEDRLKDSDKFIFVIPEYNGSFPGVLKMLIDCCEFPSAFYDKKAALVGISSGKYGNIRGIDHFTGICHYIHLNVLPLRLHISYIKSEMNEDGLFIKDDTVKFINQQMDNFLEF